jgi:hypothetical protein
LPIDYAGPYIGPFSGDTAVTNTVKNLHFYHRQQANYPVGTPWLVCVDCHDLPVVGHFSKIMLGRRPLEANIAAGTIGGPNTRVISYTGKDPVTGKSSCLAGNTRFGLACHSGPNVPRSWYNN